MTMLTAQLSTAQKSNVFSNVHLMHQLRCVLQRVAACCSVLQYVAKCCKVLPNVAVCCNGATEQCLQYRTLDKLTQVCVAVCCCSVL